METRVQRLLSALTIVGALAFVQPSCFTMHTWSGLEQVSYVAETAPPELVVHRVAEGPRGVASALVVELPDPIVQAVAPHLPGLGPQARRITITPNAYPKTIAILLALAAANDVAAPLFDRWYARERNFDRGFAHGSLLRLDCIVDDRGGPPSWRLVCVQWMSDPLYGTLSSLPGFRKRTMVYTKYVLEVPCTAAVVGSEAPAAAEPIRSIALTVTRRVDGNRKLLPRILWTPVAVAGDVVSLPLELIWWLTP